MRFELRVLTGKHVGKIIPVAGPTFEIGRAKDCHLRPKSELVSRFHCRLKVNDAELLLVDLDSTNGTRVNGEPQHMVMLRSGDRVQVGPLEFEVVASDSPTDSDSDVLIECLAPSRHELSIRCRIVERADGSLDALCEEIRIALGSHHPVFCPCSGESRLAAELAVEGSPAKNLIGRGFARVIVLDLARACNNGGKFEIESFWRNTFVALARELNLEVPAAHHNDRSCIEFLLDLPRSLLCLLNVDRVPPSDLGSLRSITQEQHPALVLYRSAASELLEQDSEFCSEGEAQDRAIETGLSDSSLPPEGPSTVLSQQLGDNYQLQPAQAHMYPIPSQVYPGYPTYPGFPINQPILEGPPSPISPPVESPSPQDRKAPAESAADLIRRYRQRR